MIVGILFTGGCAFYIMNLYPFDFERFHDKPLTEEVAVWLDGGEQSKITDRIMRVAEKIKGSCRRERLYKAMQVVWRYFTYDGWLSAVKFERTADELYKSRKLGGCSDFALVEIVLFRTVGIPAKMVITANVDWMVQYQMGSYYPMEGHSFIEVFLEDKWYLVDSTYRWLYSGYDPKRPSYPHGEYFLMRGKDFWDMGLRNADDMKRLFEAFALKYPGDFNEPHYPKAPL